MKLQIEIDQLQHKKSEIEQLLEIQKNKLIHHFDPELEAQFWKDRQDRLIKMIVRAIVPAIKIFIIFELISLPLNYLTTAPEHRLHDVGLTMLSYTAGWIALFTTFAMAKRPAWHAYYNQIVAGVICFALTIVQSVLLSMHSLSMTWRGSLIIAFATMFAYLCSGLRPKTTFMSCMCAAIITCLFLWWDGVHRPIWIISNTLILSNLVGLALAVLAISTERIRFLQSIIIEYDKKIYSFLNEHFIRLSQQDTLTLLGNRRGFEQQLMDEIQYTQTYKKPFSLLFIDVDYFKLYNDCYGHDQGDQALIRVAQTLLRHLDDGDTAIRYGGEEFVVLLKDVQEDQAKVISQHILDDIALQKIEHRQSSIADHLTISIGLTMFNGDHDIGYSDLLKQADQALYHAKSMGRNCYYVWNREQAELNLYSDLTQLERATQVLKKTV